MVHHVARACKALQHALNSLKRRFSHKMMDPDKKYVHLGAVQQPECPGNHIRWECPWLAKPLGTKIAGTCCFFLLVDTHGHWVIKREQCLWKNKNRWGSTGVLPLIDCFFTNLLVNTPYNLRITNRWGFFLSFVQHHFLKSRGWAVTRLIEKSTPEVTRYWWLIISYHVDNFSTLWL